jgi:valyl-tRNA synthetase
MSKSKGKVVTPLSLAEQYGSDGLRYWACRAAPGADTAIDEPQMKNGRRLAIKILNASRFVLGVTSSPGTLDEITEPVDRAMLAELAAVVDEATASFEGYQYQQALARSERFFWRFCDDYLELVKERAYGDGPGAGSAQAALALGLSVLLRLHAPFLPFVTEEVWSWWQEGSIHRAAWPSHAELELPGDAGIFDAAAAVLSEVHKVKTSERRSLRTPVARLEVADTAERLALLRLAESDLRAASVADELTLREAAEPSVSVELRDAE